jgi:MYXO-CTERM domain-containing protein
LAGASWSPFAADFTVNSAGSYLLGIRNSSLSSPYFINYEAFSIQPIPEPSTLALGLLGLLGAGLIQRCCRRRAGQ